MNARNVEKPSRILDPYKYMKGLTLERNLMKVSIVVKHSVLPITFENVEGLILQKKHKWKECGKAFRFF